MKPNYVAQHHEVDGDPRWTEATEDDAKHRAAAPKHCRHAVSAGHYEGVSRNFLGLLIGAEAAIAERDADIERLEITNGNLRNEIARLDRRLSKLENSLADARAGQA